MENLIIKKDGNEGFIPAGYDIDNIVFDDILITAWDINHRTPRFFSKWSYKNYGKDENKKDKMQDYSLTLDQMTLASSGVPMYFYPYKLHDNLYASGHDVAASPAMYAIHHAIDRLKKDINNLRVINIGNINVLPDYIDPDTSLAEWLQRLPSLYQPSKRHTMKHQTQLM